MSECRICGTRYIPTERLVEKIVEKWRNALINEVGCPTEFGDFCDDEYCRPCNIEKELEGQE